LMIFLQPFPPGCPRRGVKSRYVVVGFHFDVNCCGLGVFRGDLYYVLRRCVRAGFGAPNCQAVLYLNRSTKLHPDSYREHVSPPDTKPMLAVRLSIPTSYFLAVQQSFLCRQELFLIHFPG
jgi:hypothetical protein